MMAVPKGPKWPKSVTYIVPFELAYFHRRQYATEQITTEIVLMGKGTLYFVQEAYCIWITVAFDLFLTCLSSGLGVVIVDSGFLGFFHSLISQCFYPLRPCRATWCTSTFSVQGAKRGKAITQGTGSAVACHVY